MTKKIQVLLIEDSKTDAELYRLFLQGTGYFDVCVVHTLKEGVKQLITQGEACRECDYEDCSVRNLAGWDIVLLDLMLPDSPTPEYTVETIREATGIPIIVLSGKEDGAQFSSAANGFFNKREVTPLEMTPILMNHSAQYYAQTIATIKAMAKNLVARCEPIEQ